MRYDMPRQKLSPRTGRRIPVQYKIHPTTREILEDVACALNKTMGQVLEEAIAKLDAELRAQLGEKELRAYRDRTFDYTVYARRSQSDVCKAA
jgi:hypothetical protein